MKNGRIDLKASEQDEKNLQIAAKKLGTTKVSKVIFDSVKQVAEAEMFFCDRRSVRDVDTNIEAGKKNLQYFFDEFLKVTEGKPITMNEIQKMFGTSQKKFMVLDRHSLKELIIDKMLAGQSKSVGNLKLDESGLRSLIIVPDLENLFEVGDRVFEVPMVAYRDVFYWQVYEINEGQIVIIPNEVEKVKNQFRASAETPHELKKLSKVRDICKKFDMLLEGEIIDPEKLNVKGLLYYDSESGKFEPDQQFIKYGLQKTLVFTHEKI